MDPPTIAAYVTIAVILLLFSRVAIRPRAGEPLPLHWECAALAVVVCAFLFAATPIPFQPLIWKSCPHLRCMMLRDFLEHHSFLGLRSAEVINLLGPPDKPYLQEVMPSDGLYYYVGCNAALWLSFAPGTDRVQGYETRDSEADPFNVQTYHDGLEGPRTGYE